MAQLRLEPPEPFDFSKPEEWSRWKRRFDKFRIASGLAGEEDPRQISTLPYCMGEEDDEVLRSTTIAEDDSKKYDKVIETFETFFQVRRNVIFERARFHQRSQHVHESIEQYITALYSLAETCEFAAWKEVMIRDRIVVGTRDQALAERLICDADLTIKKCNRVTRQREAVREQQNSLKEDGSQKHPIVLDEVRSGRPGAKDAAG